MAETDILFLSTLRKPETQTLGGVSNLKFLHVTHIYKMAAIFQFFIMANSNILFPSSLGKPDNQTLGEGCQ